MHRGGFSRPPARAEAKLPPGILPLDFVFRYDYYRPLLSGFTSAVVAGTFVFVVDKMVQGVST
jgi:hypothetical protein